MNQKDTKPVLRDPISRREFIKISAAGVAAVGAAGNLGCSSEAIVPRKPLGKTGMNVSILALGGGSALTMVKSDDEAVALLDLARRKGINYFDTGAEYDNGKSEKRFGMALAPHRKEIYLSTKYGPGENPDELMKKFEESLKRFNTDYIDVANMHGLTAPDDAEKMFQSGALETLVKLKEQGVVKNIGATAHRPRPLLEGMKRFRFDSVYAATNATRLHFVGEFDGAPEGSFEDEVIPLANEQGIGLWAFKVTGQRLLIQKNNEPNKAPGLELIRYGFSLPVHGVILGMTTPEHVVSACELAANFKPMTTEEMKMWNERLAPSISELTYTNPSYVDDGGWRAHLA